jgi:hypothetical protein
METLPFEVAIWIVIRILLGLFLAGYMIRGMIDESRRRRGG